MKLIKITSILILSVIFLPVSATTYYVSSSNSGRSDNNAGTSQSAPWATIDKVNTSMSLFKPGDSILFNCGDKFAGQVEVTVSGTIIAPIVFGAYGTGAAPIISGAKEIAGWKLVDGQTKIYEADCPTFGNKVQNFFVNYASQPLSRFPNTGYRRITANGTDYSFTDNTLTSAANYWLGGDAVVKRARWVLDRLPIASQTAGGYFTLTGRTIYATIINNGYFIVNHINAIDNPGEWAYNATDHKIYYYPPSNILPNTDYTEASFYNNAFSIKGKYNTPPITDIVIQDLDIKYQNSHAIDILYSERITISNNTISYTGVNGVYAYLSSYIKVLNNNLFAINNNGIEINSGQPSGLPNTKFFEIRNNNLKNIASIPGLGQNNNGQYMGIKIEFASDAIISDNRLDTIGYNGIMFSSCYNVEISRNVVKHACMVKDDGGAYYTVCNAGYDSTIVKNNSLLNNIALDTKGCSDGDFNTDAIPDATGLYFDDRTRNLRAEGNTSYNCNFGMLLRQGSNNIIRNNLIYKDVTDVSRYLSTKGFPLLNNQIVRNQFITDKSDSDLGYLMLILSGTIHVHLKNVMDSNYYLSPFKKQIIWYGREFLPNDQLYLYLSFFDWTKINTNRSEKEMPLTFLESGCKTKEEFIFFAYNELDKDSTFILPYTTYRDKDNKLVPGSVTLKPFSSIILFKDTRSILNPALNPRGITTICQGKDTSIFKCARLPLANNYIWKVAPENAGIITSNDTSASIKWDKTFWGNARIFYTAAIAPDTFYSESIVVAVNPLPTAPLIINGPTSVVYPTTQSIYSVNDTISRYEWVLTPGTAGTIVDATLKVITVNWNNTFKKGTVNLGVRLVNDCGKSNFKTINITIDSISTPTGLTILCQGTISTVYSAVGPSQASTYVWLVQPANAGTVVSSGTEATVQWNQNFSGLLSIFYIASNPGTGYSVQSPFLGIRVNPLPSKPGPIVGPDSVIFYTAQSAFGVGDVAQNYEWTIVPTEAGIFSNSAQKNISITWGATYIGTAVLQVRLGNDCGWSDYSRKNIKVDSLAIPPVIPEDTTKYIIAKGIPNVFTPNGDTFNDYWTIPNIDTYPDAVIIIYNRFNKKIYEFKPAEGPWDGTISGGIPLGIGNYLYVLKLNTSAQPIMGYVAIIR